MRHARNRIPALLLALLLAASVLAFPVTARAEPILFEGKTFQNGLGEAADLQGAKNALLTAVKNRSPAVDLSSYGLGTDQLATVYDEVFFENPGLFYLEDGYSYLTVQSRKHPGALVVGRVEPSYYREFTAADVTRYETAVREALSVLRPGMSDFDKALALHDWLALRCAYDDTLTHYSPYHALVTGTAVCQGYLLAYSDLLNRAGVTNSPAVSFARNHGWNTVLLDGAWYHVDVTWDHAADLPAGWVLHTNYLRSDQGIQSTGDLHRDWIAPDRCTSVKYEQSFLTDLNAPVLYPPEGGAYFLLDGRLCRSDDLSSLRYQVVSDRGTGRQGTYDPRDARLLYWDGSIYYTDAVSVYQYDLATGVTALQGSRQGGRGFLYSLSVRGDDPVSAVLQAEVRTSPYGPVTDTLLLKPTLSAATAHLLVCPSAQFRDVSAGQWYHEAVDYVLEEGLMNGVSATAFSPDGTTTRAMIVTILYRLEDEPGAGAGRFSDVDGSAWYAGAVGWAADNGIVTGVTDTEFRPDDPITREQLSAILFRYAAWRGMPVSDRTDLIGYRDAEQISGYARQALAWAAAAGLVTGRTANTLAPGGSATRAETAAILMRLEDLTKRA